VGKERAAIWVMKVPAFIGQFVWWFSTKGASRSEAETAEGNDATGFNNR
jgi:hypothetical protein